MGDVATPPLSTTACPFVPCRNHEDRATEAICGRCADLVCGLCTVWSDGMPYCPSCIVRVRALDVSRPEGYIPWEDRRRLGTLRAAWRTVKLAYSDGGFYETMPQSGGIADPLLFALLIRSVVVVVYGLLAASVYLIIAAATSDPLMLIQAGAQVFGIFFQCLQAVVILLVACGMIHLAVRVFGGDRGYEQTFRVYAYGRGLDLMELVPIAGQLAAVIWRIIIYARGLTIVQKITSTRALIAASVPFLFILFLWFLVFGLVIVMVVLLAGMA